MLREQASQFNMYLEILKHTILAVSFNKDKKTPGTGFSGLREVSSTALDQTQRYGGTGPAGGKSHNRILNASLAVTFNDNNTEVEWNS